MSLLNIVAKYMAKYVLYYNSFYYVKTGTA